MVRYGGTIQPVTGDRLMILFGVPVAQEDHARRAVLAIAQKLSHPPSVALALDYAAMLHQFRREPRAACTHAEAAMALCAEQDFSYYLAWGRIMQGWAVAAPGEAEGSASVAGTDLRSLHRRV